MIPSFPAVVYVNTDQKGTLQNSSNGYKGYLFSFIYISDFSGTIRSRT